MNTVSCLAIITLCIAFNAMANDTLLKVNFLGIGYTKTEAKTYSTAEINLCGIGIVDLSDSTINGLVEIKAGAIGRVILNHANPLDVNIGGIVGVYNLKESSRIKLDIGGIGSVQQSMWYPAWYLRNPWIGYIVVPMLMTFLFFKGFKLAHKSSR